MALGIPQFVANPGGAPANAAVAAAKLGADAGFVGCVGKDAFGAFLGSTLVTQGVDVAGLVETDQAPTTLAVVSVDSTGERRFQFYRKPGADICLHEFMLDKGLLEGAKILHFGSVSLTSDLSRSATMIAVRYAKERGALITYDPNYRANLLSNEQTAAEAMRQPLWMC